MSRKLRVRLTPELIAKSVRDCQRTTEVWRTCLVAQALREADDGNLWRVGYSLADAPNTDEGVRFPPELEIIIRRFSRDGRPTDDFALWFTTAYPMGVSFELNIYPLKDERLPSPSGVIAHV